MSSLGMADLDALARRSRRAALGGFVGLSVFLAAFGLSTWHLGSAEREVSARTRQVEQLAGSIADLKLAEAKLHSTVAQERADLAQLYERKKALEATVSAFGELKSDVDGLRSTLEHAQHPKVRRTGALDRALSQTNNLETKITRANEQAETSPRPAARPHSDYAVGLNTLNLADAKRQALNAQLKAAGYRLLEDHSVAYDQRPAWFATRSTVLFYRNSAEPAAKELATLLSNLIGTHFDVARGSGLGVSEGREDVTFFVHYIAP
jgi:cell division protein FtsB